MKKIIFTLLLVLTFSINIFGSNARYNIANLPVKTLDQLSGNYIILDADDDYIIVSDDDEITIVYN